MEGQRRQGGASWAYCPARSRSRPTAARSAWCSATASPASPQSLRPWAEHLAAAGLTVRLPRLPGHGTRWQDLNDTRWPDWYGEVERAFDDLRGRCRQVFAMGLSMGGTLVTRLAEQRPAEVAGLVLVNPSLGTERKDVKYALPVLHRVVPSLAGIAQRHPQARRTELAYDRTPLQGDALAVPALAAGRGRPRQGTAPVLLFRSRVDHVVEPLSGRLLREGAASTEVTEVILEELPRRDARQRRPGDLRRQPRVRPHPHPRPRPRADMTGDGRRGRRDNGLDAVAFVPLVDVDPRVGEHLLDVLGSAGVPAFLEPSADVEPYTRDAVAAVAADRPAVGRPRPAPQARRSSTPRRRTAPRPEPPSRDDEPSHGLSDAEEERAWQAIIAGFDAAAVEPPRRRHRPGLRPDADAAAGQLPAATGTLPGDGWLAGRRCRPGVPGARRPDRRPVERRRGRARPAPPDPWRTGRHRPAAHRQGPGQGGRGPGRPRPRRPESPSDIWIDGPPTLDDGTEEHFEPPPPPPVPRPSRNTVLAILLVVARRAVHRRAAGSIGLDDRSGLIARRAGGAGRRRAAGAAAARGPRRGRAGRRRGRLSACGYPRARVKLTETVEITGHLMDTGVLARVLDDVLEYGGDYKVDRLDLGREHDDESYARIAVGADDAETLQRILNRVQIHGVNPVNAGRRRPAAGPRGRRVPGGVLLDHQPGDRRSGCDGRWHPVDRAEMDCGLVVTDGRCRTVPVVRRAGRRAGRLRRDRRAGHAAAPDELAEGDGFGFMSSTVSSEKPQALLVRQIAERVREVKAAGDKVLWVGGPAIVHTGAAPGDGRAGPGRVRGRAVRRQRAGHARHRGGAVRHVARRRPQPGLRRAARARAPHPGDQPDPRRPGRSRAAVEQGVLTGGVMHAMVQAGKDVRAGRLGPRRRPAAGRLHRRHRGPAGDARRAARRRLLRHGRDDAALDRDREHPARVGAAGLRGHQPGDGHQAGRPRAARRRSASSPTPACSWSSSPASSSPTTRAPDDPEQRRRGLAAVEITRHLSGRSTRRRSRKAATLVRF